LTLNTRMRPDSVLPPSAKDPTMPDSTNAARAAEILRRYYVFVPKNNKLLRDITAALDDAEERGRKDNKT